jgi:peptide chain release factor subunit 1
LKQLRHVVIFPPPVDATAAAAAASLIGGENGFNQAIELASDMLANVKFVQEKRLISKFFDEISQDTGKFVFSVKVSEQLAGTCSSFSRKRAGGGERVCSA